MQRRLKEGWKGHSGRETFMNRYLAMLKILDWKSIFVLISEHGLLPPARKPSQLTVGQSPLLLPPLLLCQIRTPCQGLCTLMALKNSMNSSAIQPRHHQPPHLGLQATHPPPLLSFLLLSGIFLQSCLCPPSSIPQTWESHFTEDKALGCLQLFTSTHHQPAVLERMEDFFSFSFFFLK